MTLNFLHVLLCLLLLRQKTAALQVTPGSSCATVCLDDSKDDSQNPDISSTTPSDIVCNDQEYTNTTSGTKFKACTECLQESHAMSNGESDIFWYLYNLRYSVDKCLYNDTKSSSSPCNIDYACAPLKTALEAGNLNPSNGTQLDYCTADGGAFSGSQLDNCIQCFRSSSSQFFMSNFLTGLQAGCEQKPQPGDLISLSGSLFTRFQVNITATPQNQTAASDNDDASHTSMTTGAIVGIAVGATLLFLGGTGLFWVHHRRRKYQYNDTLGSRDGSKSISPPPMGGYPRYYGGGNDSLPADWELRAQQPYTYNTQYYEQVEKVMESGQNPNQAVFGQHSTLPTHPAYLPRVASRNTSRNDTPSPPPPVKSNRPDTFAVNSYLNAATAAPKTFPMIAPGPATKTVGKSTLPPLPPQQQTQPQIQIQIQPPPQPRTIPQIKIPPPNIASHNKNPSQPRTTAPFPGPVPPPPPGPPPPRAPQLSLPEPSRARKPMKYAPPQITIVPPPAPAPQTPPHSYPNDSDSDEYDDGDEVLSIGFEIMGPPTARTGPGHGIGDGSRWEQESFAGYGSKVARTPREYYLQQQQSSSSSSSSQLPLQAHSRPEPQIIEQHAVDRRRRETQFTDIETGIYTGRSEV